MNVKVIRTGVLLTANLFTLAAWAQEGPVVPATTAAVHIPEGTEVPLLFVDPLSSATNAEGDRFTLRVDGDVKVGTTVALTILFGPIGLLKRGHDIDIKPGTPITAFVDQPTDVVVPL